MWKYSVTIFEKSNLLIKDHLLAIFLEKKHLLAFLLKIPKFSFDFFTKLGAFSYGWYNLST